MCLIIALFICLGSLELTLINIDYFLIYMKFFNKALSYIKDKQVLFVSYESRNYL